jgi:hypothetical protein
MASLTTSRTRVKPRCIRLCVKPVPGCAGVVRITVGKERADYLLAEFPADFGRAFLLHKIDTSSPPASYHVNIDGARRTCECKGYLKWGHCKHGDGLAALIAAGRL